MPDGRASTDVAGRLIDDFRSAVRLSGLRLTRQRDAVLLILAQSSGFLDAEELGDKARTIEPRISVATIYRTLAALEQAGLVRSYVVGNRAYHLAGVSPDVLGIVFDVGRRTFEPFRSDVLFAALKQEASRFGFDVVSVRLDLHCKTADQKQTSKS